jgi:peptidoglycan/LPS O-acetylase OafA/YrhL
MGAPASPDSEVRFTDSWASVHFDLLRGLAAIVVLLEHWRNLFFVDFPQLTEHKAWLAVPYVLSRAGHQSVVFFFVLSGFLVGGTVFRALHSGEWRWSEYLLRRVVRLWTVLLPALLLCLLWDRLGLLIGYAPGLYGGRVPNHMTYNVIPALTPHVFFGNLFFLQTIRCSVFGSDAALWSLANEFWYYILFPLGCIALWPRVGWLRRVTCAAGFTAVAWFLPKGILLGFPIWFAGAALVKVPPLSLTSILGR